MKSEEPSADDVAEHRQGKPWRRPIRPMIVLIWLLMAAAGAGAIIGLIPPGPSVEGEMRPFFALMMWLVITTLGIVGWVVGHAELRLRDEEDAN